MAAGTSPTGSLGWAPHDQGMLRHVAGHDRARAHESKLANRDTADNGGVCTNGCSPPYQCRFKMVGILTQARPRIVIICKHDGWTQEAVVFDGHPVPDQGLVLDSYPIPNRCATLNEDAPAQVAVPTNPGSRHNVSKRPDPCSGSNVFAFTESGFVDKHRARHGDKAYLPRELQR